MMPHPDIKAVRALRRYAKPGKQRGVVLLIALIALVALTLAGIALMRSVDTGNVIAGNLAFKQAALQVSDTGTEAALTALATITTTSLDADIPGQYFATMRSVDSNGVITNAPAPTVGGSPINWATVPVATPVSGYNVQYVIDRLCQGPPLPVTDIQGKCFADLPICNGCSKSSGGFNPPPIPVVYYRVTVRVTGPRNAVSMVQTILSHN